MAEGLFPIARMPRARLVLFVAVDDCAAFLGPIKRVAGAASAGPEGSVTGSLELENHLFPRCLR